jgi:polysaccharide biosynthesis transport protein
MADPLSPLPPARSTAQPSLGQEASTALLDAWKTLRKRWSWVLTVTASVVVAVAFYTAGQQRIYRSTCVIQIDPSPPKPLGRDVQAVVDLGSSTYWATAEYYRTQFEILRSRTVAEETVRRLGLDRDRAFLLGLAANAPLPEAASASPPEGSLELASGLIRSRLTVDPIKDSRLVTVAYRDANPERALQILSTVVGVYMDRNIDVALDSTNVASEWLRGQVDKLKSELEGSEVALQEYKSENRILSVSLDDQSNMLRQEMQQLSAALTSVRVRRAQVAAQAEEMAKLGADGSGQDVSNPGVLRDGTLQQLRATLAQAVAQRDSLMGEGKGELHPLVASANARVEAARAALVSEVHNVRLAAQRELAVVDHEVESLSTLLSQAEQRALTLGHLEIDYRRLGRTRSETEKLYSLVIERSKESDLTRMMRFNNIHTIDPPTMPRGPVSPRVPLNMALGLVGGLALGLLGAFARETFDQSIKSPVDLEQALGGTFLGLLPRFTVGTPSAAGTYSRGSSSKTRRKRDTSDRHAGLILHEDPMSATAEAARGIRTNISFMSPDKPYHTILVTSASPSEGKTTVACCIATAMAQAGHRTVLVDADLRRPCLHRIFERSNDRGVTSALLDRLPVASVVQETQVPNLSVLLSGPSCPNPAETLQSEVFQKMLAVLAETYDRVIIDSPPVGPVTDAVILSTRVDATVMVVRAMKSARDTVRHAQRLLKDVRANLIGTILNAADPNRRGYPEYYRYYGPRDKKSDNPVA